MRICIPSMGNRGMEEQVGRHFWKVPTFTLFDTNTNEVDIIVSITQQTDGDKTTFDMIENSGVNTVLCSSLGPEAVRKFEKMGIMVYVGADGTVKDAIAMWKRRKLKKATDEIACKLHAFRKYYNRTPLL